MPVALLACVFAFGMGAGHAAPVPQATAPASAKPATAHSIAAATTADAAAHDAGLVARFDFTFERARAKILELLEWTPLLLAAIAIVLLASWIGGFVSRRLHWVRLRTDNPYMDGLIRSTVRVVITLLGIVVALELLEATAVVSAVLGSAGLVGLVLGFAFKDIAENYIAGVLLSMRRPFAPGDHVRIDVHEGKVMALTSRATMLMTLDGNELRLPNALVFKAVVLNFSSNPKRRFDFKATIDGAQSIRVSHALALEQVAGVEGVLQDPGPSWAVVEHAPSGTVLQFFGWVDQRDSDLGKVRGEAIRRVKAAFAQAGVESPRNVQHVVLSRDRNGDDAARTTHEPVHAGATDTSVNRDIDEQLAEARQQMDDGRNLLPPETSSP